MSEYKIVSHNGNSKLLITHLTSSVNTDNDLSIHWTWPEDPLQQVALLFEVASPRTTLGELLTNQTPKYIYRNLDSGYTERLLNNCVMFKVYPASIDTSNGVVYVTEQTEGNTTPFLMRKIRIRYEIKYKSVPLSGFKYASLAIDTGIGGASAGLTDSMLSIKKVNKKNNTYICQYPILAEHIRASDNSLTYIIKSDEMLVMNVRNDYRDVIELRPERS